MSEVVHSFHELRLSALTAGRSSTCSTVYAPMTACSSLLQKCERLDIETSDEILLSSGTSQRVRLRRVCLAASTCGWVRTEAPILATMDTGACVGEMSIIEERDPSALRRLQPEPTHLLVIHQARCCGSWSNASHQFSKNLLVVLSERVRSHNQYIAESFGDLQRFERNAQYGCALTGLSNRHAMEEHVPARSGFAA